MKFPNFLMNKWSTGRVAFSLVGLILMVTAVSAQKSIQTSDVILAHPSASLEQCRNGGTAPGVSCTGTAWETGNVGSQNSHWKENDFLPYRMLLDNLDTGADSDVNTHVYTLVIGYDIKNSGAHAIDYLGTYNATDAGANPCSGVTGCTGWAVSHKAIPLDNVAVTNQTNPNTLSPVNQALGEFTMWGGTIRSVTYSAIDGPITASQVERQITVTFTAQVGSPVLAWGGHVGWAGDWGPGNSAGGITGSPYHMRNIGLDGSGGNQDRSLSADSIAVTGALLVRVAVLTPDCSDFAPNFNFPFAASGLLNPAFILVDANQNTAIPQGPCNPNSDPDTFGATVGTTVTTFGNPVNISELITAGGAAGAPGGWTLLNAGCVEVGGLQNSTHFPSASPTVSVTVDPFEVVTCTFINSQLGTTAAPVSVTGQIHTLDGSPLSGISVRLTDVTTGEIKTATTNTFGYYTFSDLTVQNFYQLTVTSKRYRFQNPSRTFTLTDDLAGVDFYCTSQ